ncbi:MAG: hypothetical protein ABI760_04225 [Ferruginibacter sp.]
MKKIVCIVLGACILAGCAQKKVAHKADFVIAGGQMPNLAREEDNQLHIVYGLGDSIMYTSSADYGNSFSAPTLIAILPGAFTFAMRGPQIAATGMGLIVTAPTREGNIFSFLKDNNGKWKTGGKINDEDSVAKEGLMGFSADNTLGYAAWLDLRGSKRDKIYGARTTDGGKTWLKNVLVYASPDSSVCECCKPSVLVKGNVVYVMFRNWLNGNRDLYLAKSTDSGNTFAQPQKLGTESWALNGCPMDGGAMALSNDTPETVWIRKGKIFAATAGKSEKEIGEGRNCTIEVINGKNVYSWTENGEIIVMDAFGKKQSLGKGSQPVLKALNEKDIICLWENERQVHASIF